MTLNLQLRPGGPWQWQWQEVRAQPATGLHILQTKQTVTEGDGDKDEKSEAFQLFFGESWLSLSWLFEERQWSYSDY